MSDQVLRLYQRLVEAVRARGPVGQPLTVAEVYQDLIPYRAVRSDIGVELNADYEHALLRLLAGEGGFVRLEPPEARDDLQRELELPDPNVGMFRKYAGCDVWIDLTAQAATAGNGAPQAARAQTVPAPQPPEPRSASASRPLPEPQPPPGSPPPHPVALPDWLAAIDRDAAPAAPAPRPFAPPPPPPPPPPQRPVPRSAPAPTRPLPSAATPTTTPLTRTSCASCTRALPPRADVRYCPFCGADQRNRTCAGCGTMLEGDWKYCVKCGSAAR